MSTDTETPRTEEHLAGYGHRVAKFMPQLDEPTGEWYVKADFARQLERELAEAKAQIEELHGWRNELGFRYNRAKDELAALRGEKGTK